MGHVEYLRILKSIEFICNGERKVYDKVGYNSSSVFSKSFLRVTGLNASLFFYCHFADHKNIMRYALSLATGAQREQLKLFFH